MTIIAFRAHTFLMRIVFFVTIDAFVFGQSVETFFLMTTDAG